MPYVLSDLEVLALAALERLGPDAYGVAIREEIQSRGGRAVSVGSLYKALHRLEERGFVSTSVGEPTAVRGGRAKKHLRIEPSGRAALDSSIQSFRRMFDGLEPDPSAR
jgi:DNA-binding PadR family transcriptional regulator